MKRICRIIRERLKFFYPVLLFFWMTYVIYSPSALFLNNISEFKMHYIYLLPTFIIVSVILLTLLGGGGIILPKKAISIYYCFIFAVTLGLYLQMNFLNPTFRTLNGVSIEWEEYSLWNILSGGVWIALFIIMFGLFYFLREKIIAVTKYIAIFLSAVQFVTLLVLIITTEAGVDNYGLFAFSKENQFSIGKEKNIVVFVIDSLQVESFEQYLNDNQARKSDFDDFTFFTNTVSGGAPTAEAMPVLLTGYEYDPMQLRNNYLDEIWEQTGIYNDLQVAGYNIKLFTSDIKGMQEGFLEGYERTSEAVVSNHRKFIRNFYKLVNFTTFPQQLKKYFYLSTSDITENIGAYKKRNFKDNLYYDFNDVGFYEELEVNEIDVIYDKTYRLYHLNGIHPPYNINANMEKTGEETSEIEQMEGVFKIIELYIQKLKEIGLYKNTAIIITGDHGQHASGSFMTNPAILIKRANEQHKLEYNNAPICFRNLVATIMMEALTDYYEYGPSVYDITKESDVERLHTVPQNIIDEKYFEKDDCWEDNFWYRVIVEDTDEGYHISTWNPYNINTFDYQLGDNIEFTEENQYESKFNYRIYKENDYGILSNEFTMCLTISDVPNKDLVLYYTLAEVMNDKQKAQIYINGKFLESVTFLEDSVGKEGRVLIPQTFVEETMVIRFVFPGAITPNMLDRENKDKRVLSIGIEKMSIDLEK